MARTLEKWEQEQYERMRRTVGDAVMLTEDEDRLLKWLAGWDEWTVRTACDLMRKIGGKHEGQEDDE